MTMEQVGKRAAMMGSVITDSSVELVSELLLKRVGDVSGLLPSEAGEDEEEGDTQADGWEGQREARTSSHGDIGNMSPRTRSLLCDEDSSSLPGEPSGGNGRHSRLAPATMAECERVVLEELKCCLNHALSVAERRAGSLRPGHTS